MLTNYEFLINAFYLTIPLVVLRAIHPEAWSQRAAYIAAGIILLYWAAPRFILYYLAFWTITWLFQKAVVRAAASDRPWSISVVTACVLTLALLPMIYWKLDKATFESAVQIVFGGGIKLLLPPLMLTEGSLGPLEPLGLSFATFRAVDLLIKVRIKILEPLDWHRTLYYGLFPPILAIGPIAEYEEVEREGRLKRLPEPEDIAIGLTRMALGAIKLFVLASALAGSFDFLKQPAAHSTAMLWLALVAYAWWFYLNFSGFSDFAIGVARVNGIKLKENFDNPYFKPSPQAFWASWHMSLTRFAQRNIYVPLGGAKRNRQYFALFMTMMVIALWHGISWPLVVFGTYHGLAMVAERYLQNRRGRSKPQRTIYVQALKTLGTFFFVALSIPILVLPLEVLLSLYARLFLIG